MIIFYAVTREGNFLLQRGDIVDLEIWVPNLTPDCLYSESGWAAATQDADRFPGAEVRRYVLLTQSDSHVPVKEDPPEPDDISW